MWFAIGTEPAVSGDSGGFDWLDLAVAIPLLVAFVAAASAWGLARRAERRKLYAEATRAALAWIELLYRVRRRGSDEDVVVRPLVERFHQAQEEITFYEGWIGSESAGMAASYRCLVREVKEATEGLITEAWQEAARPLPGNATPGDQHPDGTALAESFLRDVRDHLSLWRRGPKNPSPTRRR